MARIQGGRPSSSVHPTPTNRGWRRHVLTVVAGITLAVAVVMGLLSPTPANAQTAPITATINLQNLVSGLCADLPDTGPGQPDAPVTQYDCRYTSQDNQRWHLERHGSSRGRPAYLIKNNLGGCMDLPDYGRVDPSTPVSLHDCLPRNDNQLFVAVATKLPGVFKLAHALDHNLCLDVAGLGTGGNDARLTLWTCSDTDDHLWLLRRSATDHSGASFGVVTTNGAALTLRAEPRADSPRRGALANHTPFQIQCVTGSEDSRWYRTASGRYLSAHYVTLRGPSVPRCGGGPAEDLAQDLVQASQLRPAEAAYVSAGAIWASLGHGRQSEQAWQDAYGKALREIALREALDQAGINPDVWNPDHWDRGDVLKKDGTDAIVRKLYPFYGRLYGQRPEQFLWAGMASLAGAPVYAGMQDGAYCWCKGGEDVARQLLVMGREIFYDLAWQHQLYLDRGLPALEAADRAGLLGDAGARNARWVGNGPTSVISAWRDIDSGDSERIARGNRLLLAREQDQTLQKYYDQLWNDHKIYMNKTTALAGSPVPGSKDKFLKTKPNGYKKGYIGPYATEVKIPLSYHDPDQKMNIVWWEDRAQWFYGQLETDYRAFLKANPTEAKAFVASDVADRAEPFRNFDQSRKALRGIFA